MVKQLSPLVFEHGFKPLPGNIARTGAVEIVADFLVVCRDTFGDGAGGAAHDKEPARDFLSGADFGERTEGRWIEVQGKRFLVGVEFFSGRHSHVPVERTSLQEAREYNSTASEP